MRYKKGDLVAVTGLLDILWFILDATNDQYTGMSVGTYGTGAVSYAISSTYFDLSTSTSLVTSIFRDETQ